MISVSKNNYHLYLLKQLLKASVAFPKAYVNGTVKHCWGVYTIKSGAFPFRSLDPGMPACSEHESVTANAQDLLKTKHLSLMILDSSLNTATSTTHVHGCTRYTILYSIMLTLPWMEALLSIKNLQR